MSAPFVRAVGWIGCLIGLKARRARLIWAQAKARLKKTVRDIRS